MFIPPEPLDRYLQLPKVNLHTHLEGSVRPATYLALAEQFAVPLGFDPAELEAQFQVTGAESSLVDYLDKIFVNYAILKHPEALRRTAYEAAEDAHRDGVIYFELRAGPQTHVHDGMTLDTCIESMLAGLAQAEQDFGITCGLIVAALRNHAPEINVTLAEVSLKYAARGVVGFDLAGDEAGYPAQLHERMFAILREGGLGLTVHAGEASGWENVHYAVETLGAGRIGHGIRAVESAETMTLLRERQVLLEICPTSNVHTRTVPSMEAHPVGCFVTEGIPVSIGDDDPITSRTRVSSELSLLESVHGFSPEQIRTLQLDGLKHAFLKNEMRRAELIRQVERFSFAA